LTEKNVIIVLRIAIAATFIFSAISKLIAPGFFEITLLDQGIFSHRAAAAYFSRVLIGFELGIGLLYLQPFFLRKIISPLTLLMLVVFSGYLVFLVVKGDSGDCGCFGELIKMSPRASLMKNILLLGPVLYVSLRGSSRNEKLFVPVLLIPLTIVGTFIAAPVHAKDNFPFERYTSFEGEGRVDLAQGDRLVAIFNLECEHCQAAATELGILEREIGDFPKIYILFYKEGIVSVDSFRVVTNTQFPYHLIEAKEFFDLIGSSPPRIYWLQNGAVKKYWDENFAQNLRETFGKKSGL
jgi:uncharacterized membrane protein YphA (DoxX/SURF4 family)